MNKKQCVLYYIFLIVFLNSCSVLTQNKMKKEKYGDDVRINTGTDVIFEDGMKIRLMYFSHKRPYVGGSTKATAYILLSNGIVKEEEMISVHGRDGESSLTYDSLVWKKYTVHLKEFYYNEAIVVMVEKK